MWNRPDSDEINPNVRFGGRDFCVFIRQLATLLRSGVDLPRGLEVLSDQYCDTVLGPVLKDLLFKISSGYRLSSAMKTYPRLFNKTFVAMVKVGEESGDLDASLERLAEWRERDYALMRKIKGALVYPTFVLIITLFLTFFLFWYIIPNFMGMFEEMGKELPVLTQTALDISNTLRSPAFWLVTTIVLVSLVALFRKQWESETGRIQIFRVLHQIPVLGPLIQLTAVARFAGAIVKLLDAGMNLAYVLELGAESSGNPVLISAGRGMRKTMNQGEMISGYISQRTDAFPPSFSQYVLTGEESAQLSDMMKAAGDFYEEDLRSRIDTAVSLIEPLVMSVVAILVGFVVVAMASSTVVLFE